MTSKVKEERYTIPEVFQSVERKFAMTIGPNGEHGFIEVFGWARLVAKDGTGSIRPLTATVDGSLLPCEFDPQEFRGYVNQQERDDIWKKVREHPSNEPEQTERVWEKVL